MATYVACLATLSSGVHVYTDRSKGYIGYVNRSTRVCVCIHIITCRRAFMCMRSVFVHAVSGLYVDDLLRGLGLGHIATCDLEQKRRACLLEEVPTEHEDTMGWSELVGCLLTISIRISLFWCLLSSLSPIQLPTPKMTFTRTRMWTQNLQHIKQNHTPRNIPPIKLHASPDHWKGTTVIAH